MLELLRGVSIEGLLAVGLVIVLLLALGLGNNDLAMSIASGLIGYLGRGKVKEG